MSYTAGYKGIIRARTDATAATNADDVGGVENVTTPGGFELLETTSMNQTAGERSHLPGLFNRGPITVSANLDVADTGQAVLIAAVAARTLIYLTVLPDGTNGYRYPGYVNKADRKPDARGKVMVDYEFTPSGAPTAIP